MHKPTKILAVLAVLPLLLVGVTGRADAATEDGGVLQGGGTIYPGLTLTPTTQFFDFTLSVIAGTGVGTIITGDGRDLAGSIAEGAGYLNVTAPYGAGGVFVRVGDVLVAAVAHVAVVGTTIDDATAGFALLGFTPDQIGLPPELGGYPVRGFALAGYGGIANVLP